MEPSVHKYPTGVEKFIPAIQQIVLERINWSAKRRFATALFREPNVEVFLAHATEQMAQDLVVRFHAPGIAKTVTVSVPVTWWDHFKSTWPGWLRKVARVLRMRPPLWRYQTHRVGDIFPGLAMPKNVRQLVFYEMENYTTQWTRYYESGAAMHPAISTDVRPSQLDLPVPADPQSAMESEQISTRPELHRWNPKDAADEETRDWERPSGVTPKELVRDEDEAAAIERIAKGIHRSDIE